MSATDTLTPPTDVLSGLIDAKQRGIANVQALLAGHEAERRQTVLDGGDTSAVRARIVEAEEHLERLQAELVALEGQIPLEDERQRAAQAALADLYRRDLAFLRQRAKVLTLQERVKEEMASIGQLAFARQRDGAATHLTPLVLARLGLEKLPQDPRQRAAALADPRVPAVEHPGGPLGDGGFTAADVEADIERFEALVAAAEEAAL
jgi:hypothetical protein